MDVNYWLLKLMVVKGVADRQDLFPFLWWPWDEHLTVPGREVNCMLIGQQLMIDIPSPLWL